MQERDAKTVPRGVTRHVSYKVSALPSTPCCQMMKLCLVPIPELLGLAEAWPIQRLIVVWACLAIKQQAIYCSALRTRAFCCTLRFFSSCRVLASPPRRGTPQFPRSLRRCSASDCKPSISHSAGPASSWSAHWRPPRPWPHDLPRVMPAPPTLAASRNGGLSVEQDALPRSARPPKTSTRPRRRKTQEPPPMLRRPWTIFLRARPIPCSPPPSCPPFKPQCMNPCKLPSPRFPAPTAESRPPCSPAPSCGKGPLRPLVNFVVGPPATSVCDGTRSTLNFGRSPSPAWLSPIVPSASAPTTASTTARVPTRAGKAAAQVPWSVLTTTRQPAAVAEHASTPMCAVDATREVTPPPPVPTPPLPAPLWRLIGVKIRTFKFCAVPISPYTLHVKTQHEWRIRTNEWQILCFEWRIVCDIYRYSPCWMANSSYQHWPNIRWLILTREHRV